MIRNTDKIAVAGLGELVFLIRREKGFSSRAMAKALRIPHVTYWRVERGAEVRRLTARMIGRRLLHWTLTREHRSKLGVVRNSFV